MRWISVRPLSPRVWSSRSTITASGRWRRNSRKPPTGSLSSRIVSTPASCRMRRQPCSTIGWSSTMRTLAINRSAFLARQRDDDAHACAAARRGLEHAVAAESTHALLHAAQAEAGGRVRLDAAAVVLDRKLDPRQSLVEPDADAGRRGVPDRVGQAFLYAAIDREVDRVAITRLELAGGERERDPRMLG